MYNGIESDHAGTNALKGQSKMNEYFLRLLIRQRHEEIRKEIWGGRLSRLNRPGANGGVAEKARRFRSRLMKREKSMGPLAASLDERQAI
jgi:hypothetical protein